MSSANPGHDTSTPGAGSRSGPVAWISASALSGNAALAVSRIPAGTASAADLRADAWGHGATAVAAELRAAGVDRLILDDLPALRAEGGAEPGSADAAWARIDPLTLYGLPGGADDAIPALRLTGAVLGVKQLRAGEGVSYGYAWKAERDTRVALVTGGYAQGIVRALGNRADVAIEGSRHRIVGRVAMDVCVVDVGDAEVRRGSDVVFFGDPRRGEPSLSTWVDATGLGAGELVTAVGLRSTREYVR